MADTLCPDNGGSSGKAYSTGIITSPSFCLQLPGPFGHLRGNRFAPNTDSLILAGRLLVLFPVDSISGWQYCTMTAFEESILFACDTAQRCSHLVAFCVLRQTQVCLSVLYASAFSIYCKQIMPTKSSTRLWAAQTEERLQYIDRHADSTRWHASLANEGYHVDLLRDHLRLLVRLFHLPSPLQVLHAS